MAMLRYSKGLVRLAALAWLGSLAVACPTARAAENPGAYTGALPDNEKQLIELLQTAPPEKKAVVCKKLAIYGGKDSTAELGKLLSDEHLASWARIALEAIPDPSADAVLRDAAKSLKGKLLVGVINTIGVRRDPGAVEILTGRLKDADTDVASAAAVALGHIGAAAVDNPKLRGVVPAGYSAAIDALKKALPDSPPQVRSAVAEGLVLCAEKQLTDGSANKAVEIYDQVRKADVPKQRVVEATRGAILARKLAGIPLLVEQLKSSDKAMQQIGLGTARELPGQEVAEALANVVSSLKPEQAALVLYALLDRHDPQVPKAVMESAKSGPTPVRIAAITVIGGASDPATVATLLDIASSGEAEVAPAARVALSGLPGSDKVNAEILNRLAKADAKALPILIEIVGLRRIEATDALVKAVNNPDQAIRSAALAALGETIGPNQLGVLVDQVVSPRNDDDLATAAKALRTAARRMPDREGTAGQLATALPKASLRGKIAILMILGDVGGSKALETIAAAVAGNTPELQDTGSKLLGEWMTADAAPPLLNLAKTGPEGYRIRLLRAYLRIARQFDLPLPERVEMAKSAMAAATRPDEQKLALNVMERYPSIEMLRLAVEASKLPGLKDDAVLAAMRVAQKLGDVQGVREELAKVDLAPMKVEIVKGEYGAGANQKDVTTILQQGSGIMPLVTLKKATFNESFGGDPAPNTAKQLKITYRINDKPGEAQFAENTAIVLPVPK